MKWKTIAWLGTFALAITACRRADADDAKEKGASLVDDQLKANLAKLNTARVLFAHHSVGDNLLQGLKELAAEAGMTVSIAEQRPGANGNPKQKIDDFVDRVLKEPKDGGAQLAALKLCYADFSPSTNPDQLVGWYVDAVTRLEKERPDISLLHFTAPITVFKDDLKTKLKRMIGREVWEDASAVRRMEYNAKLREALKDRRLFDIAEVEATRPSGQRETFELGGKTYPALYAGYTSDGGHLNELGRKVGARALAESLAKAVDALPKPEAAPAQEARVD